MFVIRWIIFLPATFAVIVIAQVSTGLISEYLPWWIAIPTVIFFGGVIAGIVAYTVRIAPVPRISAGIVLILFLIFEGVSLYGVFTDLTLSEKFVRAFTDILILVGCWGSTRINDEEAG